MAELPPVSGYGTDWREEKNRELDLTQMFRRNRPLLKLDPEIKKKSTVPHARILKLTYPDGRRLNLKFDQDRPHADVSSQQAAAEARSGNQEEVDRASRAHTQVDVSRRSAPEPQIRSDCGLLDDGRVNGFTEVSA